MYTRYCWPLEREDNGPGRENVEILMLYLEKKKQLKVIKLNIGLFWWWRLIGDVYYIFYVLGAPNINKCRQGSH